MLRYLIRLQTDMFLAHSVKNKTCQSDDIQSILNSKVALKYRGVEVEAMKAIASAHQNRSLQEFEQALAAYRDGK